MRSKLVTFCILVSMTCLCVFSSVRADTSVKASTDDYQMGPGDLLHINVLDHPELVLDTRVSQSGNISYPMVGMIHAAGMSTHQLEQTLAQRLTDGAFIKDPQVSIIISDYESQKVGVLGQVTKPGEYSLTEVARVLDVLSQAGGVLSDSAADQATLVRKDGSVVNIDLRRLFAGDMAMNVRVGNGDTLSVPRAPQFYIYGEVQHPGAYKLTNDMTLSQAISIGGGLTTHGTERRAVVKRRDGSGKEYHHHIKSADLLKPDDVLLIKRSLF